MPARTRHSLGLIAFALMIASVSVSAASAQNAPAGASRFRIGASTGGYVPLSSLIRAADSFDTRLAAGPAFSIEPQYVVTGPIAAYASGTLAFGTIRLGSSIQPAVLGPSNQFRLLAATAGVMLTGEDLIGEHVQPTLRLGGGIKWYSFNLTDAENQLRPTADIGLGFRGIGVGPIEATAEVRYLLSSFDQEKLPTRGIIAQSQRQNDLVFAIGFGIRSR